MTDRAALLKAILENPACDSADARTVAEQTQAGTIYDGNK